MSKVFKFNFKYVKDNASAGSWRRGYEYYKKDMILEANPTKNFYQCKVKGNFQDFYATDLVFKKNAVETRCNCPLKEKWCKHTVAIALKAIDCHAYEDWLETKYGETFEYPDEDTALTEPPIGSYIFHFNNKRRQNFFSILIKDRHTGKIIRSLENILRALIEAQKVEGGFELNSAQQAELAVFEQILKTARQDKKAGWYDIPITKFMPMFPLLSQVEEVLDERTKQRIKFSDDVWKLTMDVEAANNGSLTLALYWDRPNSDDVYPFEEVKYFSRQLKWGRYKNVIFPINVAMNELPQYIIKQTFTDLKEAESGKFIYEELPSIQKLIPVHVSEQISKLMMEERPPINVVTLGIDYDQSLKAELEFEYDGVRVPFSKQDEKTKSPYIAVTKKENGEDFVYWVKRNYQHEREAYAMLLACKFMPMQTNNLVLDKETAIDFYNYYMKQAGEGWRFEERDDMHFFKLLDEPFKMCAKIDFCNDAVDEFEIQLYGRVGEEIIDFDTIFETIQGGEKYSRVRSLGFVEYPAQNIYQMLKAFNSFDAYRNNENKFRIKTYRTGLVKELENLGFELVMSDDFKKFWTQITTFSTTEPTDLPKVNAKFRDYQIKGFNW